MAAYRAIIIPLALAVFGCTSARTPEGTVGLLPERIVLQYDYTGDWAATAGDHCQERLDLSRAVFLGIDASPDGGASAFHIARFFMLDEARRAQALVGVADGTGVLPLTVETEAVIDGRDASVTYDLMLEPQDPHHIRMTVFRMTARDLAGRTIQADLLAETAADPTIPVLSAAGSRGLCLKRL